ncbi:unnamed protein product, partial [Closterium sp. NIES-54]
VDPSEQRYLLVGSAAGAITAFDTAAPTAVDAFAHPCHPPLFTLPRAPSSASHASAHAARSLADASAPSAAGEAHSLAVRGVAWYPVDPGLFVSASLDGLVKLWDTNTLQALLSFHMPGRVGDVAMSHAQGAPLLAAAACEDGNVRLCDLASGAATHMLRASQGAITRLYQRLRLWDVEAGANTLIHYANQRAPRGALASEATVRFCMSHDGSLVFLPQGPAIQVFHTWTGESLASLHAHFDNVLLCCSHPTLPQLFSSGADRQLLSWTSPLLDQLHSPQSHSPTSRSRAFVRHIQQGPLPDEDAWSD